jgi:hypothetical protein
MLLHHAAQQVRKGLQVVALLGYVVGCAQPQCVHHQILIAHAGHHHHRQLQAGVDQRLQHVQPIHVGQVLVEQQQVERGFAQLIQTPLPGVRDLDLKLGREELKMATRPVRVLRIVLGVEDPGGRGHD